MKDDGYCGLSCTELLEKQQEILDLCIEHAKYDPEFAPKMVQRLIDKCNETKTELMSEIIQARYRSSSSTVH
jgi:hypothetical protein